MKRLLWIMFLLVLATLLVGAPAVAQTGFAEGGDDKTDDPPPPDCQNSNDPDCDDSCIDLPVGGGKPVGHCQLAGSNAGVALQQNYDCLADEVTDVPGMLGMSSVTATGEGHLDIYRSPSSSPLDSICYNEAHTYMTYSCVGLLETTGHGKIRKFAEDVSGLNADGQPSTAIAWINGGAPVTVSLDSTMTAADANAAFADAIDDLVGFDAYQGGAYIHVDLETGNYGIDELCVSIDDTTHTRNVVTIDQSLFDSSSCWKTSPF